MRIWCHSVKIDGEAKIDSKKLPLFQVFACAGGMICFLNMFLKVVCNPLKHPTTIFSGVAPFARYARPNIILCQVPNDKLFNRSVILHQCSAFRKLIFLRNSEIGVSSRSIFGGRGVVVKFLIHFNVLFGVLAERRKNIFDGSCSWVWCHSVKVGSEALKSTQKNNVFSSFCVCRGCGVILFYFLYY